MTVVVTGHFIWDAREVQRWPSRADQQAADREDECRYATLVVLIDSDWQLPIRHRVFSRHWFVLHSEHRVITVRSIAAWISWLKCAHVEAIVLNYQTCVLLIFQTNIPALTVAARR